MEYRSDVEREIKQTMESGKYKIAGLDMFDIVNNIKINDKLKSHLKNAENYFYEYLNDVMMLKDIMMQRNSTSALDEYLKLIKSADIVDNQSLEKENSFLIALHRQLQRETAIDKLIRYAKEEREITGNDILKVHNTLLKGTFSEDDKLIRDRNDKFVGHFEGTERIIDYFPIDYKDINVAIQKLADLYNARLSGEGYDNVFIQPFLMHGLYGALQVFSDGNTRFGRIMQHVLMWQLVNERGEFNFDLPPIYATRCYYPFRGKYRGLITDLVRNNDEESWNNWFLFNLNRIEDQIDSSNENINLIKRMAKK